MAGNNRRSAGRGSERTSVRADGLLGGYELPEGILPNGELWHPVTVRWWNNWRSSPQGTRMITDVDWDFLLDTALIHHTMWSNGRWEFANEVRMRVAKFGPTPEDRARLKFEIENPADDFPVGNAGDNVADMNVERRKRLANGGG